MTQTNSANKKVFSPYRMALVAVFAALICVCSWIAVPSPFNPAVPFTLQTLAIIMAGLILSPVEAIFTSLVYLMLGLAGLPIMAGFTTLYSKIFTASGGFIIGFYITPFIISVLHTAFFKLIDKQSISDARKKVLHTAVYFALAVVIGILAIDVPGVIVGKIVTNADWLSSVFIFSLSFMPTDLLKCIGAAMLAAALEKPLEKIRKTK